MLSGEYTDPTIEIINFYYISLYLTGFSIVHIFDISVVLKSIINVNKFYAVNKYGPTTDIMSTHHTEE